MMCIVCATVLGGVYNSDVHCLCYSTGPGSGSKIRLLFFNTFFILASVLLCSQGASWHFYSFVRLHLFTSCKWPLS